jgi:hypothetical protein
LMRAETCELSPAHCEAECERQPGGIATVDTLRKLMMKDSACATPHGIAAVAFEVNHFVYCELTSETYTLDFKRRVA